jgi:hypothetical protein
MYCEGAVEPFPADGLDQLDCVSLALLLKAKLRDSADQARHELQASAAQDHGRRGMKQERSADASKRRSTDNGATKLHGGPPPIFRGPSLRTMVL